MTTPISVMIADDHAMVRTGLRLLVSSHSDLRVVGECGTHQELLDSLARSPRPVDVVTLDLTMPGGGPAGLMQSITRRYPGTRIVVLTMHDDPSYARMAIAGGASAYVVKTAADTELIDAIRTVAHGGTHRSVSSGAAGRPRTATRRSPSHTAADSLSDREREVLVLVAQGFTNQQVADRLYVSVKTVESYRARLMAKLGLEDRAELTRFALETGLLGTHSAED